MDKPDREEVIAFVRRFTNAHDDNPEEIMSVYCGLLDFGQPVILTLAEILVDDSLGLEVESVVLLESLGQILNIRPALPSLWKTVNKCPRMGKVRRRFPYLEPGQQAGGETVRHHG